MPTTQILDAVRRLPFVPFRLIFADGTDCEIHHPGSVLVGVGTITVPVPHPDNPLLYERVEIIDTRHIVTLITDTPTAPES